MRSSRQERDTDRGEPRRVEVKAERETRWREWMAAAQRGDRDCYERLLGELLPFVRRVVRERVWQAAVAEDIVQDVLLSIHGARHTFRPERRLEPWVRAIARNAVIDWGRRESRRRRREVDVDTAELPAERAETAAESETISPGLARALDGLPAAQRQAVVLLKVEGLSVAEAAARVGVSPGALKLRAHRGYRALRQSLGREAR